MSTPVTIKKREEAIAKKMKEQQNRPKQQPTSSGYNNGFNTYRIQALPSNQNYGIDFSEDTPIKSFDWDDWTNTRPTNVPQIEAQNVIYKNVTIDKDNIFIFHGKDSCMSTFYEAPFKLKGHVYPNVETYYEACKLYCLIHFSCSTLVQKAKHAAGAKKIASDMMRKHNVPRKIINAWKLREGAQAVYNATFAKFDQNPDLRKKLLDTGDKIIVQCYDKDNIFGCGSSQKDLEEWCAKNHGKFIKVPIGAQIKSDKAIKIGRGRNLLGYFCMAIREQFRQTDANLEALQTLSLL